MLPFLVHRPIAVFMSFFGLIVLGLIVARSLPVSLLPDIPIPQISVQITSPNVAPRDLENTIVAPLRNQLLQVGKLQDIHSKTFNGRAVIDLDFQFGTNTNLAFIEVNEKIDQGMSLLPKKQERPRVIKANASDIPVLHLSVVPNSWEGLSEQAYLQSILELSEFSQTVLKRRIEQLPQVTFADISGTVKPEIQIITNPQALQTANISEVDIQHALQANNLTFESILVQDGHYQYDLRLLSSLKNPEDIKEIYINRKEGLIQLKDLAQVKMLPQKRLGKYLFNENEAIIITVRKQAQAQLFALETSFNELLRSFENDYPQLDFFLTNDQTRFLRISIDNLTSSLAYGAVFAFLIMFSFFWEWRAPVLICLSVPIALVITFLGFQLANISINTISLAGLILGVGLMIDNAIIIIDNIRQQKLLGLPLDEACIKGGNEVIRPLISSALTTCSVFLPLIFLSGIAGALFYDQAISISIALAASLLVSFILLPTLAKLVLKQKEGIVTEVDWIRVSTYSPYARSVDFFLRNKWLLGVLFLSLIGAGLLCYQRVPRTAFPELSRLGLEIRIDWNEPISLEDNTLRLTSFREDWNEWLEANSFFIGEQQFLLEQEQQLTNESKLLLYTSSTTDLAKLEKQIRIYCKQKFPLAIVDIQVLQNLFDQIFGKQQLPLVAHVQSTSNRQTPIISELQPLLVQLDMPTILPPQQEEINISIDQEKVQLYGVEQQVIADQLKTLFANHQISSIQSSNQFIPIVLRTDQVPFFDLINKTTIENKQAQKVPLSHFIQIERQRGTKAITANRTGESFDIGFPVLKNGLLNQIQEKINRIPQLSVHFSGQVFEDRKVIQELILIIGISMLLLYLILAAQFESLVQPLIVILTLPLGISGALLTLFLFKESLNLIALIGMVVMGGIIVNDAILKIDMMNRLSKKYDMKTAMHGAGKRRLRPILMTSLTTILALTPILFSSGLGAELQKPLALAVIGGLIVGTFASLYVIPALYRWIR